MAYLSLYRKYRSQDFDTIVGQKHVVQTLRNAIENNRLAHAYIFSGPRGTGKTSLARILAKALNCSQGMTTKPCLTCSMCEAIKKNVAVDIIEIDAASNRGIDEIRQLREQVNFVPVEGRYKVYIIDEVHMLTMEAFNALLKTLEEPPAHTIFVLATTELHKIPATILSRCQRMDFTRISTGEIIDHLQNIATKEGVTIDQRSLAYIARQADGCMRDALSLLDQLISYKGNTLNFDDLLQVMGTSDNTVFIQLLDKLLSGDVDVVLGFVDQLILAGKNVAQLNKDFIGTLRDVLLVKAGATDSVEATSEHLQELKNRATAIGLPQLKQLILLFSKADNDMRWYSDPRLVFEMAIMEYSLGKTVTASEQAEVKATAIPKPKDPVKASSSTQNIVAATDVVNKANALSGGSSSLRSMVEGLRDKEKEASPNNSVVSKEPFQQKDQATFAPNVVVKEKNVVATDNPVVVNNAPLEPVAAGHALSMANVKQSWLDLVNKVKLSKPALYILLCESKLHGLSGQTIEIVFKDNYAFHRDKIMKENNLADLTQILKEVYGVSAQLKAFLESEVLDDPQKGEEEVISTEPVFENAAKNHTDKILEIFSGTVIK